MKPMSSSDSDVEVLSQTAFSYLNNQQNQSNSNSNTQLHSTTNTEPKQQEQSQESLLAQQKNQKMLLNLSTNEKYKILLKPNKSLDFDIYHEAFRIVYKHGILGSHFFASDFVQEIGKTLVSMIYLKLPEDKMKQFQSYIDEYIINPKIQILKTPFAETRNSSIFNKLFQVDKVEILKHIYFADQYYKLAVYISNEKLPENYIFASSMDTPLRWTAIEDYALLLSYLFYPSKTNYLIDIKLPFIHMHYNYGNCAPPIDWYKYRLRLIRREIDQIIPENFQVFETVNSKKVIKKLKNLKEFSVINKHMLVRNKITVNEQKKLLRILYLFGIPTTGVIMKIRMLFKNPSIKDESLLIFIKKILQRAAKYRPNLNGLSSIFSNVPTSIDEDKYVNISWINDKAIEAVALNLDLLYRIREIYKWIKINNKKNKLQSKENISFFESINLPYWTDVLKDIPFWNLMHDIALFYETACYGFLFNSMLTKILNPVGFEMQDIIEWRDEEALKLKPIRKAIAVQYYSVFDFKKRFARLKQIVELIEAIKAKNE